MNFTTIWNNVLQHQNETFYTIRGYEYYYQVNGNSVTIFRNNQPVNRKITKSNFEIAFNNPNANVRGLSQLKVFGPSYVLGIMRDNRISN